MSLAEARVEHMPPSASARARIAVLGALMAALLGTGELAAQVRYPAQPGPRDFIADETNLIQDADKTNIRGTCEKLLADEQIPIIVVTIRSLADYGAAGLSIDGYARSLFDAWGIGSQARNYGVLLLVSPGDRKARIELGESWQHTRDAEAKRIMDGILVPNFKAGNFSGGILQGVRALDSMARGVPVHIARPLWQMLLALALFALGFGVAISLIVSGRKGWGWGLLAFLVLLLGGFLFFMFWRGEGGSSFGGGGGGGGGATGSW